MGLIVRILGIGARWLFVICLPCLLLTASISGAVNSIGLYEYGFQKYQVGQTTGFAETELKAAARGLIDYFNSNEEYISLTVTKDGQPFELFNQREIGHLKDVKGLFGLNYWLMLGTLLFVLAYAAASLFRQQGRYRRGLARGLVWGSGLAFALVLALGLGVLLDFDRLFWQFHVISFTNLLWQLDPATDYLIMLFPQGFWSDTALFCTLATLAGVVILGGGAGYYLRRTRHRPAANSEPSGG